MKKRNRAPLWLIIPCVILFVWIIGFYLFVGARLVIEAWDRPTPAAYESEKLPKDVVEAGRLKMIEESEEKEK
jgi:hypothetical protein